MTNRNSKTNLAVLLHKQSEEWEKHVTVEEISVPEPSQNEVQVRIPVRPVNPSDVMCLKGHYKDFQPSRWPAIPGLEGARDVIVSLILVS